MSISKDIVFLLEPGFAEDGKRWFCPYSAQVVGMMRWFPELEPTLDVRYVGFEKPRKPIVELIGEELQSCPVLVLANDVTLPPQLDDKLIISKGRRVISETKAILHYLALTRGLPLPH